MKLKKQLSIGIACLKARLLRKKIPLFVSWAITDRCNLNCLYCGLRKGYGAELSTEEALQLIQSLSDNGTKVIRFTGGEPFVREDIPVLINYSHRLGMKNSVSTNGILFPAALEKITHLDSVSISLDGPELVHDQIRGKGSFSRAVEAFVVAKKKKIPRVISVVLNSLNLGVVAYILKLAQELNARVFFQPATQTLLYTEGHNPIRPEVAAYREVISYLLAAKKSNKRIANSKAGLAHMYSWPGNKYMPCMAGKVFCRIDAQGNVHPCNRNRSEGLNVRTSTIKQCLDKLSPAGCENCWCSSLVELNLALSMNIDSMVNSIGGNMFSDA